MGPTIRQVLPAIMEKLGMDEKNFTPDRSQPCVDESFSIEDDGGQDEGVIEAPINVVELRPGDKKDSDRKPENAE